MSEERVSIDINGANFSYNPNESYEKEGHVYCKTCHEQIDGRILDKTFNGNKYILRRDCKCDRDRIAREEEREKQQEIERIKKRCFHFDKPLKTASIDDINGKDDLITLQAKAYVETFDKMVKENVGIILAGPVGTGKSYIAAAIANGVIEKYRYNVKFRNIPQIIRDMQKLDYDADRNQYLSDICTGKLVIFDDFGIERKTEYVTELLYAIINERYRKNKPTIITTNIPISELRSENVPTEFQRIYSRILSMCNIDITVTGKDRRKEENTEKRNKAIEIMKEYFKQQEEQQNV